MQGLALLLRADLIRNSCQDALTALEAQGEDLVVRALPNSPLSPDGSGGADGVWINPRILPGFIELDGGWKRHRFRFIMDEEVAHCVLSRAGVPNDGIGEFCQELYAAWFQVARAMRRSFRGQFTTTPISANPPYYDLGKHVGATLAGSSANTARLDQWLADPKSDTRKAKLAREALELQPPLQPKQISEFYVRHTS